MIWEKSFKMMQLNYCFLKDGYKTTFGDESLIYKETKPTAVWSSSGLMRLIYQVGEIMFNNFN